jgi:hypothetical protein
MTEKHIYADVEKPFHFWVREGQRWILRDAGADQQKSAQRSSSHPGNRHPAPDPGTSAS